MDKIQLLDALAEFTKNEVADLILPTCPQKGEEQVFRAAEVHKMRLPDMSKSTKKAPWIIHQIVTGKDEQKPGETTVSTVLVRSIFCVYDDNESEGAMNLLNLIERVRIGLLRIPFLADQFTLLRTPPIEIMLYPEDNAPFFIGEMVTTWRIPPIEKEVSQWLR